MIFAWQLGLYDRLVAEAAYDLGVSPNDLLFHLYPMGASGQIGSSGVIGGAGLAPLSRRQRLTSNGGANALIIQDIHQSNSFANGAFLATTVAADKYWMKARFATETIAGVGAGTIIGIGARASTPIAFGAFTLTCGINGAIDVANFSVATPGGAGGPLIGPAIDAVEHEHKLVRAGNSLAWYIDGAQVTAGNLTPSANSVACRYNGETAAVLRTSAWAYWAMAVPLT